MVYSQNKAENIKIAYIGGGSRGWAWGLMSDLVSCENMSGEVFLYDIDFNAAQDNEIIGNMFNQCEGAKSVWSYSCGQNRSGGNAERRFRHYFHTSRYF